MRGGILIKKQIWLNQSKVPMYDLGNANNELEGILTVGYDEQEIKKYMSELYFDESRVQGQSYDLVGFYTHLFGRALTATRPTHMETALEFGAGYGSGTYAVAGLFKDMNIIATELSVPMLKRHKTEGLKYPEAEKQITRCQINADDSIFKDNSFDLVFGTAILHHVFEPLNIIKEVGRLLKPNGIAFFAEPFEPGYSLLNVAYKMIRMLSESDKIKLTEIQREYIDMSIHFWDILRVDYPHEKEDIQHLDDKWLFPYDYFDETARDSGFDLIVKMPVGPAGNDHILSFCKNHAEGNNIELPDEALNIVRIVDGAFSNQQKNYMLHNGILVLQKARCDGAKGVTTMLVSDKERQASKDAKAAIETYRQFSLLIYELSSEYEKVKTVEKVFEKTIIINENKDIGTREEIVINITPPPKKKLVIRFVSPFFNVFKKAATKLGLKEGLKKNKLYERLLKKGVMDDLYK